MRAAVSRRPLCRKGCWTTLRLGCRSPQSDESIPACPDGRTRALVRPAPPAWRAGNERRSTSAGLGGTGHPVAAAARSAVSNPRMPPRSTSSRSLSPPRLSPYGLFMVRRSGARSPTTPPERPGSRRPRRWLTAVVVVALLALGGLYAVNLAMSRTADNSAGWLDSLDEVQGQWVSRSGFADDGSTPWTAPITLTVTRDELPFHLQQRCRLDRVPASLNRAPSLTDRDGLACPCSVRYSERTPTLRWPR